MNKISNLLFTDLRKPALEHPDFKNKCKLEVLVNIFSVKHKTVFFLKQKIICLIEIIQSSLNRRNELLD